jgi:hypothetical protein
MLEQQASPQRDERTSRAVPVRELGAVAAMRVNTGAGRGDEV